LPPSLLWRRRVHPIYWGSSNLLEFIHDGLEMGLQVPSIGVLMGVCSPALVLAD